MKSLARAISSRLERLNETKHCATEYEQTFTAASAALTAAKKQQTDASSPCQVSYLHRFSLASLAFTARRSYVSAVLGVVILSVCPSVCYTHALCDKPNNTLRIF